MKKKDPILPPKPPRREPIDLSKVSYKDLRNELQRRRSAMRETFGAGSGRPKVMKLCKGCGMEFSGREMRKHQCTGTGRINQ
jgi:hypothetical protein